MNINAIKELIEQTIPDSTAHILDPMNDGQHLQAIVISQSFEGLSLVKQHQLVMKPLTDALTTNVVHALGLKTFTPKKWEEQKNNFNI